jgi:hypothetical protein
VVFTLINFASARKDIEVPAGARADAILRLSLSADITVSGKSTSTNLADAEIRPKTLSASHSLRARARSHPTLPRTARLSLRMGF